MRWKSLLKIAKKRALALQRIQADREELERFQRHEFARYGFEDGLDTTSEWLCSVCPRTFATFQ